LSERSLDTGTDHLLARVKGGVATLVMNRPERRNAFSTEMMAGLVRALEAVEQDAEIRCVVLTGAGGAFCAGGDVKEFAKGVASEGGSFDERVHRQRLNQRATSGALRALPKPTIAALPGPAAGAGFSLALACDLRVASENAIMTTAFAKVGFSGDYGGGWFLTRLVGEAKAKELYLLSDRIDMETAGRLGIVNRVFPAETFEKEVEALALELASGPSIAHRYVKENINRALGDELFAYMDREVTYHQHCGTTEDHLAAAKAFVDKRQPIFRGR